MDGQGPLASQVVLVTGAGRNLGRAIAREAAALGARVGVNVRSDTGAAARVVAEIEEAGGTATPLVGDVALEDRVAAVVDRCAGELGGITSVVHSAAYRSHGELVDLDLAEWRRPRQATVDGAFLLTRATLPRMRAAGFGRLVFVGGSAMVNALPVGHGHVATAKAALRGFVRAIAQEAGRDGVTANVVSPGVIATEARGSVVPTYRGWNPLDASALGRMASMHEVASLCLYLCRPEAAIVNGQTLNADGGTFAFGD
jgi:3-oxoacyl-[acyl-carrier protein] reductase